MKQLLCLSFSLHCCRLVAKLCPTLCGPCTQQSCSTPVFPVFHHLLEFAQTHVYWVDDAIQLSCPLRSPFSPSFSLSWNQGLFQRLALLIRWPKCRSFSFSISPSNEYSGLLSLGLTDSLH